MNMNKKFTKCGREPREADVDELGVCPGATDTSAGGLNSGKNDGGLCWAAAGTLCDRRIQGTFAEKKEEDADFVLLKPIEDSIGWLVERAVLSRHDKESLCRLIGEEEIQVVVDEFLRFLLESEQTKNLVEERIILKGKAKEVRARLIDFVRMILAADVDESYLETRRHVGRVHYMAGVSTFAFVVSYARIFLALMDRLVERGGEDLLRRREVLDALLCRSFIDIALPMESYWREMAGRLVKLESEVERDPLTGLYSRRFIEIALPEILEGTEKALVWMADLDGFKQINDRYGHAVGDMALKRVARILHKNFKGKDFIARYGGDEFLIILLDADKRVGRRLRKQLDEMFSQSPICLSNGKRICLSMTYGMAEYPAEGVDVLKLIELADKRLLCAKRRKRSRRRSRL